jgi:hypothetical protein
VQVHEVVDLATSDAPPLRHSVDEIVGSGRKRQRRQRATWATAGAAGLVAVAVAATATLPSLTADHKGNNGSVAAPAAANVAPAKKAPQAFTAAAPFTFTFKAFDAGRFHVQNPIVASTAYQIASVYADGMVSNDKAVDPKDLPKTLADKEKGKGTPTLYAYLTLYRAGAFNPYGIKGAQWLKIDGHQAIQAANVPNGVNHRVLGWQYADNAWAVVDSFGADENNPSATQLQALVGGLSASEPAAATVPFTMNYVPAGYTAVEIGSHAMSGLNGVASARDGDFGGAVFAKPAPKTTGLTSPFGGVDGSDLPGSFQIFVTPSQNSNQQLKGKAPAEPKCYSGGFCNLWSSDGKVQVQVSSGGRLSNSEMSKVAKGIKLADVHDDATWPAATTALQIKSSYAVPGAASPSRGRGVDLYVVEVAGVVVAAHVDLVATGLAADAQRPRVGDRAGPAGAAGHRRAVHRERHARPGAFAAHDVPAAVVVGPR